METKELRAALLKYPSDVLKAYYMHKMPHWKRAGSWPSQKDKVGQVQKMLESFTALGLTPDLVSFAQTFNSIIRGLLIVGFSDSELYSFMYDHPALHKVALELSSGKPKGAYVSAIMEHCNEHPEKWEVVFDWMRETNPNRYNSILLSWE